MPVPFNYVITDSGTITAYVKGRPYTFAKDNKAYAEVLNAVKNEDGDEIVRLGTIPKEIKAIDSFGEGKVQVVHGVVQYNGKPISNSFTERILRHIAEGLPCKHLCLFLENLLQNPSRHAVNELYNFLVHRNLPITTDGCFLAYKTVDENYMDWHTHKVDNHVGCVNEMPRNEVDDEWRNACSSGFHVGALEYVTGSDGFHVGEGHLMVVKVDPRDVVSVPLNECTKCRTCKYTVVDEMTQELAKEVYEAQLRNITPVVPNDTLNTSVDDDDEEDEEEEYCGDCDYPLYDCICGEDDDDEDEDEDY